LPGRADLSGPASRGNRQPCAFERRVLAEAWSYNLLQRPELPVVIFVLCPLVIWTGLAMSPAFVSSAIPANRYLLAGGNRRALFTFFVSVALLLFRLVHVGRSGLPDSGIGSRAMITGRRAAPPALQI